MKKIISVSAFLLILSGCKSSTLERPSPIIPKYSHPDHGIVSLPYQPYKIDREKCTSEIFSKGANIDGKLVTDYKVLNEYKSKALFYSIRDSELKLHAQLKDVGYPTPILNHDPSKNSEYYAEAARMEADINGCVKKAGWVEVE